MRRLVMTLLAALAGTSLLVGLKAYGGTPVSQVVADAPLEPGQPTRTDAAATAAAGPSVAARPRAGTTAKPAETKSAAGGKTSAPAKKTTAPATRTIVGAAYPAVWHGNDYGNMQVKIVVTGSHIDQVTTIQQSNRPRNVASVLGARAVSQQDANVGNVSGATASSDAYKKSLQSAIGKI